MNGRKEIIDQGPATYIQLDEICITLKEILDELKGQELKLLNEVPGNGVSEVSGDEVPIPGGGVVSVPGEVSGEFSVTKAPTNKELLQKIVEQHQTFANILLGIEEIQGRLATSPVALPPHYDTPLTAIQVATPTQPISPNVLSNVATGAPGYQAETIGDNIHRMSPKAFVINDGTRSLYAMASQDGHAWGSSSETIIPVGQKRAFYNVWEIRIRGTHTGQVNRVITLPSGTTFTINQGCVYRVTEFETDTYINVNRTAIFITTFPNLNVLGAGFVVFTITGPLVNTTAAFRASVKNTDIVYATYAGGSLADATQRITLNPGDSFMVHITAGAQVGFAGASAGQTMELLIEADLI